MGIFTREKTKTVAQRIDAIIDHIKSTGNMLEADNFVTVLTHIRSNPEACGIKPIDLAVDILELIVNNPVYAISKYYQVFIQAEKLYEAIFRYDEDTPEFEKLRLIFIEMYREKNVVDKTYDYLCNEEVEVGDIVSVVVFKETQEKTVEKVNIYKKEIEALKEASLRNVQSIRYIEAILRDWSKNGIRRSGKEKIQPKNSVVYNDYKWWEED